MSTLPGGSPSVPTVLSVRSGVGVCRSQRKQGRAGVALHFINGAMDATAKSGFQLGKRPYLSGGLNEHGAVIAGAWDQEVAAALEG